MNSQLATLEYLLLNIEFIYSIYGKYDVYVEIFPDGFKDYSKVILVNGHWNKPNVFVYFSNTEKLYLCNRKNQVLTTV
jgi:hypothetical protein